jgi:hypothetical protein
VIRAHNDLKECHTVFPIGVASGPTFRFRLVGTAALPARAGVLATTGAEEMVAELPAGAGAGGRETGGATDKGKC